MNNLELSTLIFDVKRHSLDDGPGIRTVIFSKGCPLHCIWCHNPESIRSHNEIGFYSSECIRYIEKDDELGKSLKDICSDCEEACFKATNKKPAPLFIDAKGNINIDRTKCIDSCRQGNTPPCVKACPGRALRNIGRYYTFDELIEIIIRDHEYYNTSRGGVTLSGGEPTMHMDYASELLRKLKGKGIPTAIETCGLFEYSKFNTWLLPNLNLILFDIKLLCPYLNWKYTGQKSTVQEHKKIMDNLARLVEESHTRSFIFKKCGVDSRFEVIPRIPLIPDINTDLNYLRHIAAKFKGMGIKSCWLLPYNLGVFSKLDKIGEEPAEGLPKRSLSKEEMSAIRNIFSEMDLDWY